jgi:hypothetical protein
VRSRATWLSTVRPLISQRQMQRASSSPAEDAERVACELDEQLELQAG